MKFEDFFDLESKNTGYAGLFFATGDFGIIDGALAPQTVKNENRYTLVAKGVSLCADFEMHEGDVIIRKDTLTNMTDHPVCIHDFSSRFLMEGYDYDVYTQYSSWHHENTAIWQKLATQVTVSDLGIRPCDGATPVMGLYNRQNRKTTTFHLIPNGKWKMNATRHPQYSKADLTVIETGLDNKGLSLSVDPGETIALPPVMFYRTNDKLSLGTDKMHRVYNTLFPRKKLPVMFNTWLCSFDRLDFDALCRQADAAASMGCEIFTVDAGWFGNGNRWEKCIGSWDENQTGAFCGRMAEFSEYVRSKGMIFGLWFEPERAFPASAIAQEHPDFLMQDVFVNFSKPEAVAYMVEVVSRLIDTYHLGAMKFDFNDTFSNDPSQAAFYRYYEGEKQLIMQIRKRYPDLYLSGCASGGFRTDLSQAQLFDSFWFSDNQGPVEGLDIYKNAIKAVPPCVIEKWNVQTFLPDVLGYSDLAPHTLPVSCNNAIWSDIVSVTNDYVKGFLSGGPVGFSCDLTKFPDDYKAEMAAFIAKYKLERDFFMAANAKVICDTENFVAIEYFDHAKEHIKLHLFCRNIYQTKLTLYPAVDTDLNYTVNDTVRTGEDIAENGITVPLNVMKDNHCLFVEIEKA